mgnify:CR=1 FL=1
MNHTKRNFKESREQEDISLPVCIGVAYARFARAVDNRGGDACHLRERSLDALGAALKARADQWQLWFTEGEQLEKLCRFDEAVEAFRKALALARWNREIMQRLFRAKVAATVLEANSISPGERTLRNHQKTRLMNKTTRRMTRRPKSARIRRYYRIGLLAEGNACSKI